MILIHVPDLNDRKDDIPLLTDFFLKQICEDYGMPLKEMSKDAYDELKNINWTGNIRELRNVVERLIILSENKIGGKEVKMYAAQKS